MSTITLTWDVPPDALAAGVRAYGDRVLRAVERTAEIIRPRVEAYARTSAPWTDRTGNARSGLTGTVAVAEGLVLIYLAHTVEYGIYLELARGGTYAVIWPAVEAVLPEVFATLRALLT